MKVALTGTPGTGKTSVAAILVHRGYKVVAFDRLAKGHIVGHDAKRECDVIDVTSVNDAYAPESGVIVEGHLSHLLSLEGAVVLRCHPDILRKRLQQKGWSEAKIRENMAAEGLDIILVEALTRYGERKVAEIDTTHRNPEQTTEAIIKILESRFTCDGDAVDWTEWIEEHAGQI